MMLVAKELRIIPKDAKRPPTIMTGRQPKRFTNMLHKGPAESKRSCMVKTFKVPAFPLLSFLLLLPPAVVRFLLSPSR